MNEEIIKAIAVTAALTGTDLTEIQVEAMARELDAYPVEQVCAALRRCGREVKYKLTLADILQRIDDGYPTPEEAWSMLPRSEWQSAAMCRPMLVAYCDVSGWMDDDQTGARISFMRRYKEEVEKARAAGEPVKWKASLGWERDGRFEAEQEAQERNAALYGRDKYPALEKPDYLVREEQRISEKGPLRIGRLVSGGEAV